MTTPTTVRSATNDTAHRLAAAGIPNPRLEARLLIGHVLEDRAERLFSDPERPIPHDGQARLTALVARRTQREPLAYLLGRREFWSLTLRVTPDTLVPRPETETLVEAALPWLADRGGRVRVLDLGTGSGCLLLALLNELPHGFGVGVDLSAPALAVARANAEALGLADRARFVVGHWASAIGGPFDAVVSNPPYIANDEFADLTPEVARFEPRLALAGGVDGQNAYRAIVPELRRLLAPGGAFFVEVGAGSAQDASAMLSRHGLQVIGIKTDLLKIERCVWGVAATDESFGKKRLETNRFPTSF